MNKRRKMIGMRMRMSRSGSRSKRGRSMNKRRKMIGMRMRMSRSRSKRGRSMRMSRSRIVCSPHQEWS